MLDAVAKKSFDEILVELRRSIGDQLFERWFDKVRLVSFYRGTMTVGVPNVFFRDWIDQNYLGAFQRSASIVIGMPLTIELKVDPGLFREHRETVERAALIESLTEDDGTTPTGLQSFVAASENELALRSLRHAMDAREPRMNPLVIVGPPGSGKSHLLKAFVDGAVDTDGQRIRVLSSDALAFTSRFTMSLKMKTMEDFRASFEPWEAFCFDEIHRLKGKRATQVEFLNLITRLVQAGKSVVIASRHHPKQIQDLSPNLQSIFMTGMLVVIDPYSAQSLARILMDGLGPDRRRVSEDVVAFLAKGARGNVRELKSRVLKIYAYAGLLEEEVTLGFVKKHLDELEGGNTSDTARFDRVIDDLADSFGVTRANLLSKRKAKSLIVPRGLAVCVIRDELKMTFKEIGRRLGDRSHTSIYLMYKKYTTKIAESAELREITERVAETIAEGER